MTLVRLLMMITAHQLRIVGTVGLILAILIRVTDMPIPKVRQMRVDTANVQPTQFKPLKLAPQLVIT